MYYFENVFFFKILTDLSTEDNDVLENLKTSLAMLLGTARWHMSSEMETTVL